MSIIRQQIIDAIDTRLKSIRQENGYSTDIGVNVFPWRTTALLESELPAIIYKDISNNREKGGPMGSFRWKLTMRIMIYVASGSVPADDIRKMLSDCYKAIGSDPYWGGIAHSTIQPLDKMSVDQDTSTLEGASFKFDIIYDVPKWEI